MNETENKPYVAGVTYQIMQQVPDLTLHNEGEWSNTVSEFLAFNDAGVEMETGEFFYSMVRLLKPERVLETGTHWGVGAMYMGLALKHNRKGKLTTIEFNPENMSKAIGHMAQLGIMDHVEALQMDVRKYEPTEQFDMILLDTEPDLRFAEFERYHKFLKPGGFLFIHDLHRHMSQHDNVEHGFGWPFGKLSDYFTDQIRMGKYRPFHFSTPRGLAGFYKVHQDDYEWK